MRRFYVYSVSILFIIAIMGGVFAYMISPLSKSVQETIIVVDQGATFAEVSQKLYTSHLIRNQVLFVSLNKLFTKLTIIKPGEYIITQNDSAFRVLRKLAIGASKREVRIVIPEGWTHQEIAKYLEKQGLFSQDEFSEGLRGDWGNSYPFLISQDAQNNLEGYLFPDTYRVFVNSTPRDVIKKMLDNFNKKFDTSSRERAQQTKRSIKDIVILASIIEREVTSADDRAKVADIFYRRMKIGMPLQADSTVNYVTGKNTLEVSIADTVISSPYNTYTVKGLPPGPICNPGLSALQATLYPSVNEYLFFLTTNEGKTIFSKTFEEHVKNKKKYLQKTPNP